MGPWKMAIFFIACVFLIPSASCNKRILILSLDAWSHIIKPVNIAKHLDQYGYAMDLVLTSPKYKDKILKFGIKSLNLKIASGSTDIDILHKDAFEHICEYENMLGSIGAVIDRKNFFKLLPDMAFHSCEALMSNENLMYELLKNAYDVVIVDGMFAVDTCHSLLAYKLGVPTIFVSSFNQMSRYATPVFPPTNPIITGSLQMSFIQRLVNFLLTSYISIFPSTFLPYSFAEKYVSEKPQVSFHDLISNASLYLIDQDPIMDIPRPAMPNMKFVGGLAIGNELPLPEKFKMWMDDAKSGAIIVSFGSIVSNLRKDFLNKILKALSEISEYTFVMKVDDSFLKSKYKNILLSTWIPQSDLLAHSNTKLFISHCGNNGRMEALYHGTPMLGIPIFGDQFANCEQLQAKLFGKCLNICDLTVEKLKKSIREVVKGNYSEVIKKASDVFRSYEKSPSAKAAMYIDRFLKYGDKHLRNPALNLSWYKLYSLDVITFIILFNILCVFLFIKFFMLFWKICKKKDKKD